MLIDFNTTLSAIEREIFKASEVNNYWFKKVEGGFLKTLSPLEEQTLLNYLLPLPKHIEVRGTTRIPLKMLVLHLPKNKTLIGDCLLYTSPSPRD